MYSAVNPVYGLGYSAFASNDPALSLSFFFFSFDFLYCFRLKNENGKVKEKWEKKDEPLDLNLYQHNRVEIT